MSRREWSGLEIMAPGLVVVAIGELCFSFDSFTQWGFRYVGGAVGGIGCIVGFFPGGSV